MSQSAPASRRSRVAGRATDHDLELLRQMLLIRRFEERCSDLYQVGKIRGFLHLYIGEEAVAVGAMQALGPEDSIVSTYREHGHALARGMPAGCLMAELYGKANGCSGGHGGSMHFFDKGRRFFGGYAIVGGGLPIAVGIALAEKKRGTSNVVACFFGDGAVVEGEFHEAMNLARLWRLPVLFICENNLYAMGTAISVSLSVPDVATKAAAYDVASLSVDGMDVAAVEATTREAVEMIRGGAGPVLLECRTYRFRGHSMADPELYRRKEEVEAWKAHDPIARLIARLEDSGVLDANGLRSLEAVVKSEVDEAADFAEAGPWEAVEDLTLYVMSR
jgi:pyruvate dehydrogenase E1 component alpha subunit